MLLEDAEGRGLVKPTSVDRFSIIGGGLKERFLSFERVPMPTRAVLFTGAAFSGYYAFVIAWSPQADVPGGLGPFANPGVITGALITLAWLLAALNAGRSSRMLCWTAFASNLVIADAAAVLDWFGPGIAAAIIFAVVALGGALRFRLPQFGTFHNE
jgi:hypothetical protein